MEILVNLIYIVGILHGHGFRRGQATLKSDNGRGNYSRIKIGSKTHKMLTH